jgi:hypothetical protein
MKARPILFNSEMVRAILEDRKTQTRRVLTVPWRGNTRALPYEPYWVEEDGRLLFCDEYGEYHDVEKTILSPFGQKGDRLWVRETWDFRDWRDTMHANRVNVAYAADGEQRLLDAPPTWNPEIYNYERWRPSIHMPRWASRITLEITGVRVERLQSISEDDARAEGVDFAKHADLDPLAGGLIGPVAARVAFSLLWDSINGKRHPWSSNPWAWVIEFRKVEP